MEKKKKKSQILWARFGSCGEKSWDALWNEKAFLFLGIWRIVFS